MKSTTESKFMAMLQDVVDEMTFDIYEASQGGLWDRDTFNRLYSHKFEIHNLLYEPGINFQFVRDLHVTIHTKLGNRFEFITYVSNISSVEKIEKWIRQIKIDGKIIE